jgi:hypothetical protein
VEYLQKEFQLFSLFFLMEITPIVVKTAPAVKLAVAEKHIVVCLYQKQSKIAH